MAMSNPRPVCNQNRSTKAIATSTPIPTTCFIGALSAEEEYYVRAGKMEHLRLPHYTSTGAVDSKFGLMSDGSQ